MTTSRGPATPELPALDQPVGSLSHPLRSSGVAPDRAFTLAGRRASATGTEADGATAVRVHPVSLMRELGVAGARLLSFALTPLGVERRLATPGGVITERLLVSPDAPVAWLEWSARSETTLEVDWRVDLATEEGASAAGAGRGALAWHGSPRGVVVTRTVGDAAGPTAGAPYRAVFALSARPARLTVEPDGPDGLRVRATVVVPADGARRLAAFAVGPRDDPARLARVSDRPTAAVRARQAWADRLLDGRLALAAPDPAVDQAVEWAKLRLSTERRDAPGGWRIVDAVWAAIAGLAAGDPDHAEELLARLTRSQADDGRISAGPVRGDPARYDDPTAAALFLLLVARYLGWTGDLAGVRRHWSAALRAFDACRGAPAPAGARDRTLRAAALTELAGAAGDLGDEAAAAAMEEAARDARRAAAGDPVDPKPTPDPDGEGPVVTICAVVYGLLGARPDAARGRLVFRPRPPADWRWFRVRNLIVGPAAVSVDYRRHGPVHHFALRQDRGAAPLRVILEPELTGGRVAAVRVDGEPADLDAARAGDARWRVPVQVVLDHERTLEVEFGDDPA